jgi:HEAT repeat protein
MGLQLSTDADDPDPGLLGCWSTTVARRVARLLHLWTAGGDPRAEVLAAASHAQAEQFGAAWARAVLPVLKEVRAPELVEALGATGDRTAVGPLLEAVRFETASPRLRIALACALGELGGPLARSTLETWWQYPKIPASVRHEIRFALQHLPA